MYSITTNKTYRSGFTIVELLIVIVVIGILAAIALVTYSNVQERARFASFQSDISTLNNAVLMYAAEKGVYPDNSGSVTGCVTRNASGTNDFITGLIPAYITKTPTTPNSSGGYNYYAYCWSTGGADYKIIRLVDTGTVPAFELASGVKVDPNRGNRGWGYWSAGGSSL